MRDTHFAIGGVRDRDAAVATGRSGLNRRRPNPVVADAVDAEWWARRRRAGVRVSEWRLEPVASPRTNRSRSCGQLQNDAAPHWSRLDHQYMNASMSGLLPLLLYCSGPFLSNNFYILYCSFTFKSEWEKEEELRKEQEVEQNEPSSSSSALL